MYVYTHVYKVGNIKFTTSMHSDIHIKYFLVCYQIFTIVYNDAILNGNIPLLKIAIFYPCNINVYVCKNYGLNLRSFDLFTCFTEILVYIDM